jgi:transposase
MPRYKPVDRSPRFLPVVLSEQIQPGTFEFALDHLVDHELDLSALDARFNNDETGASAYDPRVMLKIVLLAYSRGLISSRAIERACAQNVQFMALSGDAQPSYTHIAKFVRELGEGIKPLFTQVLMTCDRLGLIGRHMFAIDGVKLPANASKERSGTHAELRHRADRLDQAADKIIELHRSQDSETREADLHGQRQARIEALRKEARATRDFLARSCPRRNRKGGELKANVTDNDSAKMATSKGVIQGYAAQAAVDSTHQVIVAADVSGSGSEQSMLLPMVEQTAPLRQAHTLITADAGYHSNENLAALCEQAIPALVADNQMRQRDERLRGQAKHKVKADPLYDKRAAAKGHPVRLYRPQDFIHQGGSNSCICPAGQRLYSSGSHCTINGRVHHKFTGSQASCVPCAHRHLCLRYPQRTKVRQVAIFQKNQPSPHEPTQLMKQAIDSPQGQALYSRRIATVEPVFANIRHNKRLNRFTVRGRAKVSTQWQLYCLVHNIEKLAHHGYR